MGQYLIDNNVISNYFSGLFSEKSMTFVADIIDQTPNLSVITQIEALSWVNLDKAKEGIIREFLEDSNIITITATIVNKCVAIKRNRKIKTPDAIIAATAIIHNFTLVTCDNDFINIQGLKAVNPNNL